jgi:hypothetical protein
MEFVCNSSQTYASEVVNNIRVYLNTQNNDLPKVYYYYDCYFYNWLILLIWQVLRFWTLEYFFALNNVYVMSSESEALIKALIDDLIYIETEMNVIYISLFFGASLTTWCHLTRKKLLVEAPT